MGLENGANLSYILMDAALDAAKASGLLTPAKPTVPWAGEPRAFLMCAPLASAIEIGKADPDEKVRQRWAKLVGDIGHFVEGGLINEGLMKQLKPEKFEHWEVRSRRPKPSLRVFGRFAKPDVFVGTHVQPRINLGGMWSAEFEHEKLVCEDHWKAAGLPDPFSASPDFSYEAYITENASRKVGV